MVKNMKINIRKEIEKNSLISHVVLNQMSQLLARELIKEEVTPEGVILDVKLTINGRELDLETFIKMGIEQHLPEVMAVLYRKVTEKTDSGVYTIEKYGGDLTIRAEQMKKMTAEQVQSALVFFYNFVNASLLTLESFLTMKQKEMKTQ